MSNQLNCHYYDQAICRSCTQLSLDYPQQCQQKQASVEAILSQCSDDITWLPLVTSSIAGFRNKAKMVVSGHWQAPILGLLDRQFQAHDLVSCPLYPTELQATFEPIRSWIQEVKLMPYDVIKRQGELKYVIVSIDEHTKALMCRFVLRSTQALANIQQYLPALMETLPNLDVVSVNIQPLPAAIVEGEQEILLTEQKVLTHWLNGLPLYCHPRSFFQTNSQVAAQLYAQAQAWIVDSQPSQLWDLFCGVGGFALHAAQVMQGGQVTGIEINADAIESAQRSAQHLGLSDRLQFRALTADDFAHTATDAAADCIIVNPPRRGIGAQLCQFLNQSTATQLIYSSCNPESLSEDLKRLHQFKPIQARVFDMFPHTQHAEVLVLLVRR
ncbi:MAG: 23S rRNA (uracil(747)-C(5))-methyltransferase RlmC [Gammaproteobacteria bacterium]|nr:23S rRNA (uracil(747)-C(5))-methyltransferase RlmC [Gammaproteobacteria bacterium]